MNALATLIGQSEGKDTDFLDYAGARLRQLVDNSLTDDILRVVTASAQPLTASEIRDELKELGSLFVEHSNPLATIHAIASRLVESGRAKETFKYGKKAWTKRVRVPFADVGRLNKSRYTGNK
ncbi:MAG TPA: hypothetical protein VN943_10650 [Candidatus Acidoferrum sp.]|nr:hypothetical protein [Candidatus Acidoferrum sp.]